MKTTQNANFVRYVRYGVRYPVRYQNQCQVVDFEGNFTFCAVCAVSALRVCAGVRAPVRVQARTHACAGAQPRTYRTPRTGLTHQALTRYTMPHSTPHIPHTPSHPSPKKEGAAVEGEEGARRVIACTPDNARQMADLVRSWPELNSLVRGLQAQELFPGLRAMHVTLTGSAEFVSKDLEDL